ncbi:hypothetical protein [Fodinicola feengrottensis]|nr:hypothetical protein [Fodinicola feengrottensis]
MGRWHTSAADRARAAGEFGALLQARTTKPADDLVPFEELLRRTA